MKKLNNHKIIILGAGFSGLCAAIKLKKTGVNDFLIVEKASSLGGTWRDNTYPGAECDIPSALYSYSFEHNKDWEFKWSGQQQILKYQVDTAKKYELESHFRFDQNIVSLKYDQILKLWSLMTNEGVDYQAQHIISAIGQLHYPLIPEFKGKNEFKGDVFHSANWNHSVGLQNKRVAVIGNAASAVQFIPEITKQVGSLKVYQRSANWVLPKLDRPYAKWEQRLSAKLPIVTKLYRGFIWAVGEYGVLSAIKGFSLAQWVFTKISLRNLNKIIKDKDLASKLTPKYAIGAKRILFSDRYYQALAQDNVELVDQPIKSFTSNGIEREDLAVDEFDVLIYATGFKTNPFLSGIEVQGVGGVKLHDNWSNGAHAYLGISTHGFPNFHMLFGPNTNLGHTSVIIMFEAQADYIIKKIKYTDENNLQSCDVKGDVEQKYNHDLQESLKKMTFNNVSKSWYMDSGKITNNWSSGTREYQRLLKRFDDTAYSFE